MLEVMQGGNTVQDQLGVPSKLMNIQLVQFRLVKSCKSIHIPRGLISVQRFQLIHASSCCADSIGVRFLSICTQFRTHKSENRVKAIKL